MKAYLSQSQEKRIIIRNLYTESSRLREIDSKHTFATVVTLYFLHCSSSNIIPLVFASCDLEAIIHSPLASAQLRALLFVIVLNYPLLLHHGLHLFHFVWIPYVLHPADTAKPY